MRRLLPVAACLLLASPARAQNPIVHFDFQSLGAFDVELCQEVHAPRCPQAAPNTVANFLGYMQRGAYGPTSFVHRNVTFYKTGTTDVGLSVIQGGSFFITDLGTGNGPGWDCVVPYECGVSGSQPPPVLKNEFNQSNLRGTVAVPLVSLPNAQTACDTDPDSGTSGWFINRDDADASIDCGRFTVFGVVVGNGMDVVDRIGALPVLCFEDPLHPGACDPVFSDVPLLGYPDPCGGKGQPKCPDPIDYLVYYSVPEPVGRLEAAAAFAAIGAVALGRRR